MHSASLQSLLVSHGLISLRFYRHFYLPNFGDENGAAVALKDVDVPVLVQAFPDEMDKMDFAHRRDSMCGKMAMCNVLRQLKIKYTLTKEFCVNPLSDSFTEDLRLFAGTCRVVGGMQKFNVGAIGARTTAFKTVRYDEVAFQNKRVNVETIDMTRVFAEMEQVAADKLEAKKEVYAALSDFGTYPPEKLENIARLGVVIDNLIEEFDLQAIAIRCWDELQKTYGVAPCLILGELNKRGIAAACELDVTNAVMMRAIGLAANYPVMLLDVNNNYEGELLDENLPKEFFGCGTVFQKKDAAQLLQYMATNGYRHHVAITKGNYAASVKEAFEKYLDYNIDLI